jgi:hypothetical protein
VNGRPVDNKRELLILPFAAVVLLSFVASLVDWILTKDSTGLTYTVPLMMALGGYVLGIQWVRAGRGGSNGP